MCRGRGTWFEAVSKRAFGGNAGEPRESEVPFYIGILSVPRCRQCSSLQIACWAQLAGRSVVGSGGPVARVTKGSQRLLCPLPRA